MSKKGGQKGGSTLSAGSFEAVQERTCDSLAWKGQRAAHITVQVSGQDLNFALVEGELILVLAPSHVMHFIRSRFNVQYVNGH